MAATGREFFTVKTVSQALAGFRPGHVTPVETVPLGDAYGRVPEAMVVARDALPGFRPLERSMATRSGRRTRSAPRSRSRGTCG